MSLHKTTTRHTEPGRPPAPTRFNDSSLEWLIAVLRFFSTVLFVLLPVIFCCSIILESWRGAIAGGVVLVFTVVAGWFGWWHFRNPEWSS